MFRSTMKALWLFLRGRLGLYRLVFRSMCWNIYSCNDKCPAEHGVLIVNPQSRTRCTSHQAPGEDVDILPTAPLGMVARKNTGWNNTSYAREETE